MTGKTGARIPSKQVTSLQVKATSQDQRVKQYVSGFAHYGGNNES